MQAVPPPPIPPTPPSFVVSGGDGMGLGVTIIVVAALAVAVCVLWPLVRALARRIEGKGDATLRAELEELRARVQDLEGRQGHVAELEERVDFAERLLAQQKGSALPRGMP